MEKVIFVLYNNPDLSPEQCLAEWSGGRHTSIVKNLPGVRKWILNKVNSSPNGAAPVGIGEIWFDNLDVMQTSEFAAAAEDAKRIFDMNKSYFVVAREERILE